MGLKTQLCASVWRVNVLMCVGARYDTLDGYTVSGRWINNSVVATTSGVDLSPLNNEPMVPALVRPATADLSIAVSTSSSVFAGLNMIFRYILRDPIP